MRHDRVLGLQPPSRSRELDRALQASQVVGLILASACGFTVVAAPPYRTVLFSGDLGSDSHANFVSIGVAPWPRVMIGGYGLRLKIVDDRHVIGTLFEESNGGIPSSAVWHLGAPEQRERLPHGSAVGEIIFDGNEDGLIVGAVVTAEDHGRRCRPAAWSFPTGDLTGSAELRTASALDEWSDCPWSGDPDALLVAVGNRSLSGDRTALAAGLVWTQDYGGFAAGFRTGISGRDVPMELESLPGYLDGTAWCGDGGNRLARWADQIGGIVQPEAALGGDWHLGGVLGNGRVRVPQPSALCIAVHAWEPRVWFGPHEVKLAESCGCTGSAPSACLTPIDGGAFERTTDVRLSGYLAGASAAGRQPITFGSIGVETIPAGAVCNSEVCPTQHAIVAHWIDAPQPSLTALADLHTIEPLASDLDRPESAVARVQPRNTGATAGQQSRAFIALGAVGSGWSDQDLDIAVEGADWTSDPEHGNQWCYRRADAISVSPPGYSIESLHDATDRGILVGIAVQRNQFGNVTDRRACYLTSVHDLDGDLSHGGGDLGILLTAWGPVQPGTLESTYDFNFDPSREDNAIDGGDLGLLLTNWSVAGFDPAVHVVVHCDESEWSEPRLRIPFLMSSLQLLGFADLDGLGQELLPMQHQQRVTVCDCIVELAAILQEIDDDPR